MKLHTIIIFLLICCSCNKEDYIEKGYTEDLGEDLSEVYNSLDLKNPDIILNEIATGEINPFKIENILSENNANVPPFRYYFEYLPNTNKISKITFYSNNHCRVENSFIYYNAENYISKVETVTTDTCAPNEFTTTFNFNYIDGILKSLISNNTLSIFERYFSYYPDGKISTIYSFGKPKSDTITGRHFNKSFFTYDINGNVQTYENDQTDLYNIKTTFIYDNKPNPLKGFYVNSTFARPIHIAGVLSENNILSTKEEYTNFPAIGPVIENISYEYTGDKVISYSYGVYSTFFINYE